MLQGLGSVAKLMRSMGEMKSRMETMQESLADLGRAKGSPAAGMVEVEVNGLGEVLKVTIEPSLMEKGDREMIEDLVPAAVNAGDSQDQELHAEAMKEHDRGIDIPGLDDALAQTGLGEDHTMDPLPPRKALLSAQ